MSNNGTSTKPQKRTNGAPTKRRRRSESAYFLSLTVENIRCFGLKQTLDLSDGHGRPARWTVILGDNGVGKTTLLQCLAGLQAKVDPWPEFQAGHVGPQGAVAWPRGHSRALYRQEGQTLALSAEIARGRGFRASKGSFRRAAFGFTISNTAVQATFAEYPRDLLGTLICYGYGAWRRVRSAVQLDLESVDTSANLFQDDAPLVDAAEWLLQADYQARKRSPVRKQARKRVDTIKSILKGILPDVRDIRFPTPSDVQERPRVEFLTPYGWVTIGGLGLGYQSMIAWTVDLASRLFDRYQSSADPIAEPAIVLVDEIDLHLHPSWQRKIMRYLSEQFKNTQFIVTTHSPLIVQAASDANVVLLRREGDHVVIDNDVAAVEGWRVDQVLTSELFGLESARPERHDALLRERERLLSKPRLSKADKERLDHIAKKVVGAGVGETPMEMEALNLLRRAALAYKAPRKVQ